MPGLPRIVVTLSDVTRSRNPGLAARKNDLYLEAVRRGGGDPVPLDPSTSRERRESAFADMDGLMLTGGADLDPALYGAPHDGVGRVDLARDELERTAWDEALRRRVPVLGICRGLQAINVFMGGSLVRHLDGHQGPRISKGSPRCIPCRS